MNKIMKSLWNIAVLQCIIGFISQIECIPLDGSIFHSKSFLLRPTTRAIRSEPGIDWMSRIVADNNEEALLEAFSTSSKEKKPEKPDVKSLNVISNIAYRYANTLISSRVANPADVAQEVFFSVVIPETAFISGFVMEIDGKPYRAYVKEKEEAQRVYDNAVRQGQTAGHVKQSARDSNRFSVSVNIEPKKKVTFNLTYEELLKRELGVYRHVINLNPGQVVDDLTVDVFIREERNITKLRAPEIQSGNEVDPDLENKDNNLADVEIISPTTAKVSFRPTVEDQKRLMKKMIKEGSSKPDEDSEVYNFQKMKNPEGLTGQFIVEYDVVRDPSGGQVLINDGYFVHFFAPTELPPLRKHVLFVLDVSGSMNGRKIEQLKHAMDAILSELHPDDYFNIIEFSYSVTVHNLDTAADSAVYSPWRHPYIDYDESPPPVASPESTHPFPATPEYIKKAKEIVQKMSARGGTNINDALKTALEVARRGIFNETKTNKSDTEPVKREARNVPEPMIIFLTDGEPTVGVTHLRKILTNVDEFNHPPKATIFSLAFGDGADFKFLKKLSLAHNGFARQIYEAADASWQLRNFYNQISSPLLSNVSFVYPPDQIEEDTLTKRIFNNLFGGSELVVSGRIKRNVQGVNCRVMAKSQLGLKDYSVNEIDFIPQSPIDNKRTSNRTAPLEKLWAYMTIRQLLDEQEILKATTPDQSGYPDPYVVSDTEPKKPKPTEPTQTPKEKALMLALKYSFVCPLTSLVVVKPTGVNDVDTEPAKPNNVDHSGGYALALARPQSGILRGPGAMSLSPLSLSHPPRTKFSMHQTSLVMLPRLPESDPFSNRRPVHHHFYPVPTSLNLPGSSQSSSTLRITSGIPSPQQNQQPLEKLDVFEDEAEAESSTPVPETPSNLTLDSIRWLNSTRNGDELQLGNKEEKINCRLGLSEPNVPYQSCKISNTTDGVCRHLRHCVQQSILDDVALYVSDYFCIIPGNFAGICCPEIKESEETTEESTALPTTTEENKDVDPALRNNLENESQTEENSQKKESEENLQRIQKEEDSVTTEKSETDITTEKSDTETTVSSLDLTTEQTTISE